jgi:hypothetical protein
MCHSAKIMSEIFYSRHFASKCQIRHIARASRWQPIFPLTCANAISLAAILAVSENYGHANIREIRRVAMHCNASHHASHASQYYTMPRTMSRMPRCLAVSAAPSFYTQFFVLEGNYHIILPRNYAPPPK